MAEKDVDEQFAAIMARWNDEALGRDPFGDPQHDDDRAPRGDEPAPDPEAGAGPTNPVNPVNPVNPAPLPRPGSSVPVWPRAAPQPQDRAEPQPKREREPDDAVVDDVRGLLDDPEDDAHYSPPAPAPLPPSEDKHFWTMLVALVGGPLLFLYLLLFNRDGNGWWMTFSLLVAIAGFVLLVLRQPLERDEDDDGIRL
ncbi:MAG: hypothetical protein ABJA89_05255 [Lapillicoccus sp.]